MKALTRSFVAVTLTFLFSSQAHCDYINYGDLDGGGTVKFLNATANNDDFDPLTATGDCLDINPINFEVQSVGGGMLEFSSTVSTTIMADPGLAIDEIVLTQFGDYTIFGSGMVSDTLEWKITEINGVATNLTSQSVYSTTAAGTSIWSNGFVIDQSVFGSAATEIAIEWTDTIMAESASATDVAFIKTKSSNGFCVTTTAIPEPGSLGLLLIGAIGLIRCR